MLESVLNKIFVDWHHKARSPFPTDPSYDEIDIDSEENSINENNTNEETEKREKD